MAAGGRGNSFVGFLDLEKMILPEWEPRALLPKEIYQGASVPYQDSFLIVGGYNQEIEDDYLDSIYYYNPITDNWDEFDEKLTYKRRYFTAFLVPDSFANCS